MPCGTIVTHEVTEALNFRPKSEAQALARGNPFLSTPGPAETVGQVGHLPYHFLVVHTGNDVCYDFYPR